jgi:ATP-dependent phosphoenolpyruvate carboxykinase
LKFLQGDLFRDKLIQYAKPLIIKGVPPMILDLKELYVDSDKTKIIEDMLLSFIKSMKEHNTLGTADDEE